jgi:hypothetical protein
VVGFHERQLAQVSVSVFLVTPCRYLLSADCWPVTDPAIRCRAAAS